jgi:polysaccharide biosynthesis protein PelG
MTSISLTIETMTRRGTLSGVLAAYVYAALLVAGPWIFTVLGLLFLNSTTCEGSCIDLTVFRSVVIYNSMYSLIITSPLAFISGRYASEKIYQGRVDSVLYSLVVSIGIFIVINIIIAVPFYVYGTTLNAIETLLSIQNATMIGCSWLLIPFLGAMRAYNAVLVAFSAGALVMLGFGSFLHDPQAVEFLLAFNSSLAITNLIMLATVIRRFGPKIIFDPELKSTLGKKWELPAAGAAYALGLWVDKIIMWHSDPSSDLLVAGGLRTMPSYDAAMFWAQLSSIPIIAVFFVHVETRFSTLIHAYHTRMQQRASLRELNEIVRYIRTHVLSSMFGLFSALVIVAAMMIMLSFVFMPELGLRPAYMGIFRVSLCSMAFYTSAMFCFSFLIYLDLRRPALLIVLTFLVLNGSLTMALLQFGPDLYGYGNMIAATVTLLVGFSLVLRELSWLHYHAFVTNNPSL